MKQVYLVKDLRLAKRSCALAEMLDNFVVPDLQRKAAMAFHREADMLATLDNPHIPRVYDSFSEKNRHYLVMEYVKGTTLEEKLAPNGGRLAEDAVMDIGLQTADALAYLHGLKPPVIYRDLKPSNVMVTPGGLVKLIDFGIAHYFQPSKTATAIGTQGYAAPEQYKGKAEVRSDIYALGATMHHLLTGRDPALEPPFSFPPIEHLHPKCNPALAKLINETLAYKPEDRPASAGEFTRRLVSAKAGVCSPTAVVPGATAPSALPRPFMPKRGHPVSLWVLAGIFGLVAAKAAASYLLQSNRVHRPEIGEAPEAKASPSPAGEMPASASTSFSASADDVAGDAHAKSGDVNAWLHAARSWFHQAKATAFDETFYPLALNAYKHVLELSPGNLEALRVIGYIELRQKDYEEAITSYERYFSYGGDDPNARLNLAAAYLKAGGTSNAIQECKKVLAENPFSFRAEFVLGEAYASTNNYSEALEALQKAAKLAPDETSSAAVELLSTDVDQRRAGLKTWKPGEPAPISRLSENSKRQVIKSHPGYFTIGSTKAEVLAIQGSPKAIERWDVLGTEDWQYERFYGGCQVEFSEEDSRVTAYDNSCGQLHVRIK